MEVILLDKIRKLGELGEQVKVKPGFGRNYLIPNGKAIPATAENVANFEARRAELEKVSADSQVLAKKRQEKLLDITVSIPRKAGAEGKLYGSVGTADIAKAITAEGVEVAKDEVRLPDGSLRLLGEFEITLHLHADVEAIVNINIVSEEG